MTPEEFWKSLDATVPFRGKEYKGIINPVDKDLLFEIKDMSYDDSCMALYQVAKQYSQIDQYPKELVQAIYFVIMKQLMTMVYSEEGKKKYFGKDGKVHKSMRLGISKEVFMTIRTGVIPSKQKDYKGKKENYLRHQERMGIKPYRDFFWKNYEEVGFRSRNNRGILDVLIRRILEVNDYPAIIDLSGDCTILEALYFAREEFIFCRDSNACILYNTLKTDYQKFRKLLRDELKSWDKCIEYEDLIKHVKTFEGDLKKETKKKAFSQKYGDERDSNRVNYRYIFMTYPCEREKKESINRTKIAVKYFLWKLYEDSVLFDSKVFVIAEYLHERIKNVGVIYDSAKELVNWLEEDIPEDKKEAEKIKNAVFLPMVVNGVTKPRLIKSTYFEEQKKTKDRHKLPDGKYSYTDGRLKKGVIFLDLTVNDNYEDRKIILKLVKVLGCKWIVVCKKSDDLLKEELGSAVEREIYLKEKTIGGYYTRLQNSYNKKILTNIKFEDDIFCKESILFEYELRVSHLDDAEYLEAEKNWKDMDTEKKRSLYKKLIYTGAEDYEERDE